MTLDSCPGNSSDRLESMTRFEFVHNARPFAKPIWEVLQGADDEFVPPLSERAGTTQRTGLENGTHSGLTDYYEDCLDQPAIIAREGDALRGFLSFRHNYEIPELAGYMPTNYVSTIIVRPARRRTGYARGMYETLLTGLPSDVHLPFVTTRTWGTNRSHLALLDDLGFSRVSSIEDDRGDGIDTVYYGIETAEFDRVNA